MARQKTKTEPKTVAKPKRPRADEQWLYATWSPILMWPKTKSDRVRFLEQIQEGRDEVRALAKRSRRSIRELRLVTVEGQRGSRLIALFVTRLPRSGTLERDYTPKGPVGPRIRLTYRKMRVRKTD